MFRTTAILGGSDTLRIIRSGGYSLVRKPFEIDCPEVYIRVHFWTRVFAEQKRRRCVEPRTSMSVLNTIYRKPFEIDDADARSVQKTPAGVLDVRRGLFFVKRQRRCTVYFKRTRHARTYPDPSDTSDSANIYSADGRTLRWCYRR